MPLSISDNSDLGRISQPISLSRVGR